MKLEVIASAVNAVLQLSTVLKKLDDKRIGVYCGLIILFCFGVSSQAEPQLFFVHSDHLNTPQMLTDQNGQVVWKVESQTPFGVVVVNEDVDQDGQAIEFNIRFPGQYYDSETGLSYNYYRTYDSSLGRYIQSDPIGLDGGINTYGYVEGNPLIYTDPYGLQVDSVSQTCSKDPLHPACSGTKLPKPKPPKPSPKKSPIKPDKRKGLWACAVVACCNDNIPGNCPTDHTQQCKQAVWASYSRNDAIKSAESIAKIRLGCQAKHVTVRCTGPKGENYHRGG
ncbi:RHS repeat-associated core domain-containing protein [Teredinibacter turnerae]|uniref:RHS repeat domain-containing protein n=1 Tax=Teredinibacter turnerae TaxID=2426 RepID=UPI0003662657|nr:RHS repeat-associated core domain-containing protein [Teredinibacter turnerae]